MKKTKKWYYRCWARHQWPVEKGQICPTCNQTTCFPKFTIEVVADGIEHHDDFGGGGITMIDIKKVPEGNYLDGDFFVGRLDGPEFDEWCRKHGV